MMRQVSRPVRRRAGRKGRKDLARSLSCNKATCLSLLSNAVLVWNTVHMTRIIQQLRANGETILDEELSRISPLAFAHVIPNGTYCTQRKPLTPEEAHTEALSPLDIAMV
jgi:Tn3 transposase DDE domain